MSGRWGAEENGLSCVFEVDERWMRGGRREDELWMSGEWVVDK